MKKQIFPISCVSVLIGSVAVSAQSIDYGSLEFLFDEAVTTSATGKPQRASEAPVTMEILTSEEIRKSGYRDIPNLLRLLPGLDVIQRTQSQYDVGIRGYNQTFNNRLLVLINGRQVFLDHFNYVAWSTLPVQVEEIRQIEVVKGPNTALFGFNAVSGVINIVTFNPLYDETNTVSVGGGLQNEFFISSVNTVKLGKQGGFRLSMGYRERDAFDGTEALYTNIRPDEVFLDREDNFSLTGDLRYKFSNKLTTALEGTFSRSNVNERQVTFAVGSADYETYSVKGNVEYDAGTFGTFKLTAYSNWMDLEAFQIPLDFENQVTIVKLEDLVKIGAKSTVRLAAEYRNSETTVLPTVELDQANATTVEVFAFSGMWDYAVSSDFSVTASARMDIADLTRDGFNAGDVLPGLGFSNADFEETFEEFSLNIGGVYRVTEKDTVRATVGRGISFPSTSDFGISLVSATQNEFATPFALYAVPGLEPSTVWNYEIGYTRAIDAIGGSLNINLFYQEQLDLRAFGTGFQFVPAAGRPVTSVANAGDSEMMGAEIALEGKMGDFDWALNYTFIDIDDDLPPPGTVPVPGLGGLVPIEFEDTVANHRINAKLGYTKDKFHAEVRAYYGNATEQLTGALGISAATPVGDFLRIDASTSYQIDDTFSVQATVTSAFDDSFAEQPVGTIERRAIIGLRATF